MGISPTPSKVIPSEPELSYVKPKPRDSVMSIIHSRMFKILACFICLLPQLTLPPLRNVVMEQYLTVVGKLGVRTIFFPINLIYDYVEVKETTDSCFWMANNNATSCEIRFTDDGEPTGNWTTLAPDQSLIWTVLRYGSGSLNETNDLFVAVLAPRSGEVKKKTTDQGIFFFNLKSKRPFQVTLFDQEAKAAQYISNRTVPYLNPGHMVAHEDEYNLVVEVKAENGNLKEFIGYRDYKDMDAYGAWYRYHSYGVFTAYDDNRFANMPGYGYGFYGTTITDNTTVGIVLMRITRSLGIIPGIWCLALWIAYTRNYIATHRVKSFKQLSAVSEDLIGIWINQYPFLLILCAETLYTLKYVPSLGIELLVAQEGDLLMRLALTGLIWPFVLALKLIFHLLKKNINITFVYYLWSILLVFVFLPKTIVQSYLAYYLETNVVDNINIQYDYEFNGEVLNKQHANMG